MRDFDKLKININVNIDQTNLKNLITKVATIIWS